MDRDIFIKISNDRDERFRTITRVVQGENGRYVIKVPENPDAYAHVRNIVQNRSMLEQKFQNSKIRLAQSELYGDGVRIAWVEGHSFADYLDKLIDDGEIEACLRNMDEYFSQFFKIDLHFYRKLPEDVFCFETNKILESEQAVSGLDIDMLFQNVVYDEKEKCWTDYDYEWVLNCDIPVRFFIFRCLNYYLTTKKRVLFLGSDIYERYQISNADRELYGQMEDQLQKYIAGKTIPLWKMYKTLGGAVVPVIPLAERRINCKYAEVFFDFGKGFSAEESEKVYVEEYIPEKFRARLEFPTGTQVLRFDPVQSGCILKILHVADCNDIDVCYTTNETSEFDGVYLFLHDDPQIIIPVNEKNQFINIEYALIFVDADDMNGRITLNRTHQEILRQRSECEQLKDRNQNLQQNNEKMIAQNRRLQLDNEKLTEQSNKLQMSVENLTEQSNKLQMSVENLAEQSKGLQNYIEQAVVSYQLVTNSISWKMTRPLRGIKRVILRIIRKIIR